MANWFRKEKIKDLYNLVKEQYPELWEKYKDKYTDTPTGFDLVQTDDGEWAVVAPVSQPQQFDEERSQIVRLERNPAEAIEKGLQRIPLVV